MKFIQNVSLSTCCRYNIVLHVLRYHNCMLTFWWLGLLTHFACDICYSVGGCFPSTFGATSIQFVVVDIVDITSFTRLI